MDKEAGTWERKVMALYKNHKDLYKAIATGRQIDNGLKVEYTKGGTTDCKFHYVAYEAYFEYEALVKKRLANRIINQYKN